ncbi:hypothetical protein HK102_013601 [Quaeritorhiza haematococci]|nr:hypothetical protein HK102_013601 [Quaeritorhiza haematococci]
MFPTNLEDFNYAFNEQGELRHKETGERFLFEVRKGDFPYNQAHYEALGDAVTKHIEDRLQSDEFGLLKKDVPVDAKEGEPRSYIYLRYVNSIAYNRPISISPLL